MEVLPPAELRPRISNSVCPGPAVRMAMPGTDWAGELKSVSPRGDIVGRDRGNACCGLLHVGRALFRGDNHLRLRDGSRGLAFS
jgi:hypothetical protein